MSFSLGIEYTEEYRSSYQIILGMLCASVV